MDEYQELWTNHDEWGLSAIYYHECEVVVIFAGDSPSIQEISALRKLLEQYAELSLQAIRDEIGICQRLNLGLIPTIEIRRLEDRVASLPLTLEIVDRSSTHYLPIHRPTDSAL